MWWFLISITRGIVGKGFSIASIHEAEDFGLDEMFYFHSLEQLQILSFQFLIKSISLPGP
jgi:hypothetical protein